MRSIAIVCAVVAPRRRRLAARTAQIFPSSAGNLAVETVARGLDHPWSLAFLPDGRMLVTERPGRMRIVAQRRQAVAAARRRAEGAWRRARAACSTSRSTAAIAQNQTIYFCFAEPAERRRPHRARARAPGRRRHARLDDVKVIFRQEGPLSSGNHFGCRIAQAATAICSSPWASISAIRDEAQNLGNHLGKIVRMRPDGSVPPDNPFVGRQGAKPEIWSYGHRNPQGAAHPSADRQAVGARARPARRRRGQHPARRARTTAGR